MGISYAEQYTFWSTLCPNNTREPSRAVSFSPKLKQGGDEARPEAEQDGGSDTDDVLDNDIPSFPGAAPSSGQVVGSQGGGSPANLGSRGRASQANLGSRGRASQTNRGSQGGASQTNRGSRGSRGGGSTRASTVANEEVTTQTLPPTSPKEPYKGPSETPQATLQASNVATSSSSPSFSRKAAASSSTRKAGNSSRNVASQEKERAIHVLGDIGLSVVDQQTVLKSYADGMPDEEFRKLFKQIEEFSQEELSPAMKQRLKNAEWPRKRQQKQQQQQQQQQQQRQQQEEERARANSLGESIADGDHASDGVDHDGVDQDSVDQDSEAPLSIAPEHTGSASSSGGGATTSSRDPQRVVGPTSTRGASSNVTSPRQGNSSSQRNLQAELEQYGRDLSTRLAQNPAPRGSSDVKGVNDPLLGSQPSRVQELIKRRHDLKVQSFKERRSRKPTTPMQGGSLGSGTSVLKRALKRAQEAWNDQVQAKREPKSPWGLWKTKPGFQMSKASEFSLAVKDYSRALLEVLVQARRDKHLGLDEPFFVQHAKLVGFYVGNTVLPKSTAPSIRSMRSLIVEIPTGSCLMDYLATTDRATYGHMVADDTELLLQTTPNNLPSRGKPMKRRRNEVPAFAAPSKRKFGSKQLVERRLPSLDKPINVQRLYGLSKSLNAPIVVSERKKDNDDFDASQHTEFVLQAVLPSLFGTKLAKPSHTILLGGATKGTLLFTKQDAPKLSWPANPPIWVDTSKVASEMFVLYCAKRNILLESTPLGRKGVAVHTTSLAGLLERLPVWFFTNLMEYTSMAQVDLGVLAELMFAQSLLYEFRDFQLNTMMLTDKAGLLAQLGRTDMLDNLTDQLGASNDWNQESPYMDASHVANMLVQAKHLYS